MKRMLGSICIHQGQGTASHGNKQGSQVNTWSNLNPHLSSKLLPGPPISYTQSEATGQENSVMQFKHGHLLGPRAAKFGEWIHRKKRKGIQH